MWLRDQGPVSPCCNFRIRKSPASGPSAPTHTPCPRPYSGGRKTSDQATENLAPSLRSVVGFREGRRWSLGGQGAGRRADFRAVLGAGLPLAASARPQGFQEHEQPQRARVC